MKREIRPAGALNRIACALALTLLLCGVALAQSGRSTVRGTVKDPQGNVVAGASVTLTNTEKNFSRTQTTNDEGGFVFNAVPPDQYRVEVRERRLQEGRRQEVSRW